MHLPFAKRGGNNFRLHGTNPTVLKSLKKKKKTETNSVKWAVTKNLEEIDGKCEEWFLNLGNREIKKGVYFVNMKPHLGFHKGKSGLKTSPNLCDCKARPGKGRNMHVTYGGGKAV